MRSPAELWPLPVSALHFWWPFLRRGLDAIKKKTNPDWIPEDIYAALRYRSAEAVIGFSYGVPVGFFVWYKQERPFSGISDIFIWAAWTIPLRERVPPLDVGMVVQEAFKYMRRLKQLHGCQKVIALSPRRGLPKLGFRCSLSTWEID